MGPLVDSGCKYSFGSFSRLDLVGSGYRYGLTTVDRKDVGPLSNLTVYVSPLTVSRLCSPS